MKKTAVQSLYEWFLSDSVHTLDDVKKRFLAAQEEEKQQILDAVDSAFIESYKMPLERDFNVPAEYYSITYKTPIK